MMTASGRKSRRRMPRAPAMRSSGPPNPATDPLLAGLLLLPLLFLFGAPAPASAQSRWVVGGGLAVSVPRAELNDFIDEGYGVGGQLLYRLDPAGVLSLRLDGAAVTYGKESFRTPLSRTVSRVLVDVETRNSIALLGFGPQLTLPAGPIRPYVNGAIGLGYFFTESSVEDEGGFRLRDREIASTTNFDDLSFSWGGGGGIELAVGSGSHPLLLQLDVQYRNHGRTEFLREGSIEEDDGRVTFDPLRAEADLLLVRLGVGVGL